MQEVAFPVDGAAPRVVPRGDPRRFRLHHVRVPIQRAEQADVVVDAVHTIGVVRTTRLHAGIGAAQIDTLHGEHADIAAGAPEVLPEAKHTRVGAWIQIVATLGDGEQSQAGGLGQLAGQSHTAVDRDLQAGSTEPDAPGEEEEIVFVRRWRGVYPIVARGVTHIKHAGVFEKEIPLFRKELRELREVHLLLIGLGLPEVRIQRDIEGEPRRYGRLKVDTHRRVLHKRGLRSRRGAKVADGVRHRERLDA